GGNGLVLGRGCRRLDDEPHGFYRAAEAVGDRHRAVQVVLRRQLEQRVRLLMSAPERIQNCCVGILHIPPEMPQMERIIAPHTQGSLSLRPTRSLYRGE